MLDNVINKCIELLNYKKFFSNRNKVLILFTKEKIIYFDIEINLQTLIDKIPDKLLIPGAFDVFLSLEPTNKKDVFTFSSFLSNFNVSNIFIGTSVGGNFRKYKKVFSAEIDYYYKSYLFTMNNDSPSVTLKLGVSLDGKIALANGESKWITSKKSRADVQLYRASCDALISSSTTIIKDNASLNVRINEFPQMVRMETDESTINEPIIVILDRQNNLTPNLNVFKKNKNIIIFNLVKNDNIIDSNIIQIQIPREYCKENKIDLSYVLRTLKNFNIDQVLIECGSKLASSFLKQRKVNELVLYQAPKIMGGDSFSMFGPMGYTNMNEVIKLSILDITSIGEDLKTVYEVKYE